MRLPQSATFAEYAIRHIKRLVGDKMLVDMNEATLIKYQNDRLTESAAPKTVNEEVGFLLRIMGDLGDLVRVRLKKKKKLKLKVRNDIGKAYSTEEKERMLDLLALPPSDILSDRFCGALHRLDSHLQPGQDFDLFAAMIEGGILAHQGLHANAG